MSALAFGPFRLDLRSSVLSKHGALTPLSPKLVQVLACLAEARGELVTRDLQFERCWPGLMVTDATGWSLAAEPMFAPLRAAAGYARLAARLASRAS